MLGCNTDYIQKYKKVNSYVGKDTIYFRLCVKCVFDNVYRQYGNEVYLLMYEYNFRLVKVVDGDTVDVDIDLGFGIWIHNERIRMMGIDTPESRTRDKEEKKFGLAAKERITQLLAISKCLITFKDKAGKFGRVLGDFKCYDFTHDMESTISRIMIHEGHGVSYHGQSKEEIAEEHLKNRVRLYESGAVEKE